MFGYGYPFYHHHFTSPALFLPEPFPLFSSSLAGPDPLPNAKRGKGLVK